MARSDHVVKLLMIEDSVEEAEQLISTLRNGGIAVRPARADSIDELAVQVASQTPDMILCNPEARALKLTDVAAVVGESGKDIAIIALVRQPTEATIVAAFTSGGRWP